MSACAGPSSSTTRFFASLRRSSRLSVGGGFPRTKRQLRQPHPLLHDHRERARDDLREQRPVVAVPHVLELDAAVRNQAREHVEPAGGALRIGLRRHPPRQPQALHQRREIDAPLLEYRRQRQVQLGHGQHVELVLHHGIAARQEAGLQAVGDRPQPQVEASRLNLVLGERLGGNDAAIVMEGLDPLVRQNSCRHPGEFSGKCSPRQFREQRRCVVVRFAHLSHLPRPGVNDDRRPGRAAPPASAYGRPPTPAFSVPGPRPMKRFIATSYSSSLRRILSSCAAIHSGALRPFSAARTSTHRARSSANATVTFSMAILRPSPNPNSVTRNPTSTTRIQPSGRSAVPHAPPRPSPPPGVLREAVAGVDGERNRLPRPPNRRACYAWGASERRVAGRRCVMRAWGGCSGSRDGGVRRRGGTGAGGRAGGAAERGDDRAARPRLRRAGAGRRGHRGAGWRVRLHRGAVVESTTATATCSSATSPATASSDGTPTGPSATS